MKSHLGHVNAVKYASTCHSYLHAMCPNGNGMTDEIRNAFLNAHNMYRSQIAKGEARNALGGYAPKAARMLKMV
ncbi:hypothetical protein TELCIR_09868 [Teladorsagia circumcincta]|uniref:SCP domain-containing protein n=1 Tax=Teladorsagia circumcincta TaxID=45464 RepID=A0A2G9UDM9_TELCI|nr:hypothetical protein TELCIR_09868 [Teladorsagia circumcincta]